MALVKSFESQIISLIATPIMYFNLRLGYHLTQGYAALTEQSGFVPALCFEPGASHVNWRELTD